MDATNRVLFDIYTLLVFFALYRSLFLCLSLSFVCKFAIGNGSISMRLHRAVTLKPPLCNERYYAE